jgi:hypothetical protein
MSEVSTAKIPQGFMVPVNLQLSNITKNKIMPLNHLLVLLSIFYLSCNLSAQDMPNDSIIFPSGITLKYGTGHYSHKDQYISEEKYTGTLPYLSFGWARKHNRYVYRLEMAYRGSSDIKNYNVTATVTQLTLNQGFLYPLREMALFKRNLFLWIGPSSEFYYFYNKPHIAVSGFDYAQSFAALLSLGLNAECIYPVNKKFQTESSLRFTLLSVGGRVIDNEEDDQSPARLLTLLSGLHSSFDLGARYYFISRLSVNLAYRFELTRISKWEPLFVASDNVIIGMTYRF